MRSSSSPHPAAKDCCADAARILAEAAKEAGAPDGVIQVIDETEHAAHRAVHAIDERIDLILATGGRRWCKAAYRSGNPAIGVGPGNAPVWSMTAPICRLAAKRIVASKSFDNSILCTNESAVMALESIADPLLDAMKARRRHVCTPEETQRCGARCCSAGTASTSR